MADHPCPGCGAPGVPHHQLGCKPCWFRLPKDIRDEVNRAYRARQRDPAAHRRALREATLWWRDNPAVSRG